MARRLRCDLRQLHFIGNEQGCMAVADFAEFAEEVVGRDDISAFSLNPARRRLPRLLQEGRWS